MITTRAPDVLDKVANAIAFAMNKHKGQTRLDGGSQIDHVRRVSEIASRFLDRYDQDDTTAALRLSEEDGIDLVTAAVLHDILEDTDTTDAELAVQFGERVAQIVRAVSHDQEEEPDEVYLRRVADGGRLAVIVKRSDRLDNLNTLRQAPPEFRKRKLTEIRTALHLWYWIDPDGAPLIEELLQEVERESSSC